MGAIQKIGFIGLGTMGGAFAANLVKAGFEVVGHDPFPAASAAARNAGAQIVETPAEAAAGADLVAILVPDVPQIEEVLGGNSGLLTHAGEGRVLMVMSTIDPGAVNRLAETVGEAGWRYVDCPIGRTADDARRANSTFMLGGAAEDKTRVTPMLEAIGSQIIDCGDVGHGMMIKVVNNFMSTVGAVLTAEALRLAEAGGVKAETVLEVVNGTVAMNGHSKNHYPNKVLVGDVSPGFAVKHARKDCKIAEKVMARLGMPNYVAPAAIAAYDLAMEQGHGDNDWSDMYNVVATTKEDT